MNHLLELRNVTKEFSGGTVALDDVSFSIDAETPSIISIAGESGSGKSTMGMMILGFLEPTNGEVLFQNKPVSGLSSRQEIEFRTQVQAVFQDPFAVFNPFYKVDHIIEEPIKNYKLADSKEQALEMTHDALTRVGLRPEETLGRFPHQLSGGQRQRLVVARALLMQPKLIVADEPVSMVDASLRATILETLHKLKTDFGITILYITHDLTTAYHVSDHIIILYRGSVMEAGEVDSVITDPKHPYTQLLIDSIPWPDLTQKWGQQEIMSTDDDTSAASVNGCKFAGRCPHVMDVCKTSRPPLFRERFERVASCFLYQDADVLPGEQLGDLFTEIDKANKDKKASAADVAANGSDVTADLNESGDESADADADS
jgi:oligopeptide/dipeptide ABC transporter ATP-binding protein